MLRGGWLKLRVVAILTVTNDIFVSKNDNNNENYLQNENHSAIKSQTFLMFATH